LAKIGKKREKKRLKENVTSRIESGTSPTIILIIAGKRGK